MSAADHLREKPVLRGSVVAVALHAKHRFSKTPRLSVILTAGYGVEGDAHHGQFVRHRYLARRKPRAPNLRQVHLIPSELFDALRNSGFDVGPGDLGENITTAGLDLETLPLNTQLRIGISASLRLTGLRTPCILIDRFKSGLKSRLLTETPNPPFRAGIMAVVSEGGEISPGDTALSFPSILTCLFPRFEFPSPRHVQAPPRSWISGRMPWGVTASVASVIGRLNRRRPALPGLR